MIYSTIKVFPRFSGSKARNPCELSTNIFVVGAAMDSPNLVLKLLNTLLGLVSYRAIVSDGFLPLHGFIAHSWLRARLILAFFVLYICEGNEQSFV